MAIGPFSDCEGLISPTAKAAKLRELDLWFEMARILGTDIIQIPCTFQTEGFTGDLETVANDLREIADLGAKQNPPFRFAYENLCFGTFNNTWSKAWAVVKKVDRDNFGMCLDTFNIAGREYADPESPTGKVQNAELVFAKSLRKMVKTIDVKKVFYIQVVDAERLEKPLVEGHEFFVKGQRARMSWSRNCRLFACEEDRGGYLPILDVVRAICDEKEGLGYKGWISFELFNRTLVEDREEVPREHAERSMESWARMSKAMGWEAVTKPTVRQVVAGRKTAPRNAGAQEVSARL
jgi:4-hydroxyphenylpyruvate dioxygenase